MKNDIDYEWGWKQIQRMTDNAYGAASNQSNIVSHMRFRSIDAMKVQDELAKLGKAIGWNETAQVELDKIFERLKI